MDTACDFYICPTCFKTAEIPHLGLDIHDALRYNTNYDAMRYEKRKDY